MFSYFRNWMLPVKKINQTLSKSGLIYEVGSGHGSLAYELAKNFPRRQVVGIDIDQAKIAIAKNLFVNSNLTFRVDDAKTFSYLHCDGVVLSDFLHHLKLNDQVAVLKQAINKLNKQGYLLVKEIDLHDSWRMRLSRLWDWLLYPRDQIYYRSKSDWVKLLHQLGLEVKVTREVVWFPGSTYLYICQKK